MIKVLIAIGVLFIAWANYEEHYRDGGGAARVERKFRELERQRGYR